MGVNYFAIALGSLTFEYVYSMYLNYRQGKLLKVKTIPDYCEGRITQEEFIKSQQYSSAKLNFKNIQTTFTTITTLLSIYVLPDFWNYSLTVIEKFGYSNEILRSCAFFVITTLISNVIELPFSYYYQFVLESKFGYNNMTIGLFIKDKVMTNLLMFGFGLPILSLIIYIINWAGPLLWLCIVSNIIKISSNCWLFLVVISMLAITIYPTFIQPLFNKYVPVDGELAEAIYKLAERVGFPASKETIFVVDNSKRNGHMNAYFYGLFGKKRIVLYDTLVKEMERDEILAVMGHEFGHYKMSHSLKQMLLVQIHFILYLYSFSLFIHENRLYQQFGFESSKDAVFVGLTLFTFLYSPIERIFNFIINIFSRRYEYQADNYAVNLGFLNSDHLYKLHFKELSSLIYDPLYSAYHHSHPTLAERVDNINKQVAKLSSKNK